MPINDNDKPVPEDLERLLPLDGPKPPTWGDVATWAARCPPRVGPDLTTKMETDLERLRRLRRERLP